MKQNLLAGISAASVLVSSLFAGEMPKTRGKVCFTFDDARYNEWIPALPLFRKYHAHATFFFHGKITEEALNAMKQLQAEGHSIGLHTVNHLDAVPAIAEMGCEAYVASQIRPQLDVCERAGLKIRNFAYPNNRRTEETDRALASACGFLRFRAGVPGHSASGLSIAQDEKGFLTAEEAAKAMVLGGFGIGSRYKSTQKELDEALEKAASTGKVLVFFSHGISDQPKPIDVSLAMLEACLRKAEELGLEIVSFDELSR